MINFGYSRVRDHKVCLALGLPAYNVQDTRYKYLFHLGFTKGNISCELFSPRKETKRRKHNNNRHIVEIKENER